MTDAELLLTVHTDRGPDWIETFSSELARDLARQPGIRVHEASAAPGPGTRGGGIPLLGQLLLTLVGAAGIGPSLVGCLRAYIDRDRTLKFTLKRENGEEIAFDAHNLKDEHTATALETLQAFVMESKPAPEQSHAQENRAPDR
jgi:hypothetical protein